MLVMMLSMMRPMDEDNLVFIGRASTILLPPMVSNMTFHVTNSMPHLLQMKGLFRGLPQEDTNCHIKNFAEVCQFFNIDNIFQESISLRLYSNYF